MYFVSDETGLKGAKLRRAILLVWLANKVNIKVSTAQLRKMCGYTGSGLYSARDSGWFSDTGDRFILTDKAKDVLDNDLLPQYLPIRLLLIYSFIFIFILLVQSILNKYYNTLLIFSETTLVISLFIILLVYIFYYRIIWFFEKRASIV